MKGLPIADFQLPTDPSRDRERLSEYSVIRLPGMLLPASVGRGNFGILIFGSVLGAPLRGE
jgi:hypothetical protein